MSYQDSSFSTMYDRQDDYDLDEDNEEYIEEDRDAEDQDDSDEGMCDVHMSCFHRYSKIVIQS